MLVLALIALLVPALAYAALIYVLDLHEREPAWALAACFVLGGLAAPVSLALERALLAAPLLAPTLSGAFKLRLSCFGVIAPVEESCKLLATLPFARRSLMNEPVDGLVYAGFSALGFAASEGLMGAHGLSPSALLLRALLPVPAHVFFAALWGAGLGALRYWGRSAWPLALLALLAAIVLHGGYDYLLMVQGGALRGAVVALLAMAGIMAALLFRGLLAASPFRGVTPRAGACVACERPYQARCRFCAGCGELLVPPRDDHPPLDFSATLLSFVGYGGLLLMGALAFAALRQSSPSAAWRDALAAPEQASGLWLWSLLSALLPALLVRRAQPRAGQLDLLMGCAFAWLATLLYLTLSAPEQLPRALWLALASLLCAQLSGWLTRPAAAG